MSVWYLRPPLLSSGCGGNLTGTSGSFTSSHYPHTTSKNMTCTWLIITPPRLTPTIQFPDFQVENPGGAESDCQQNYMELYDGDSGSAPKVGTYCGVVSLAAFLTSYCGE